MQNKVNNASIKNVMPHGSLKEVAAMAGVTIYTVSRVLNGKSNNRKVLKSITDYLSDLKSEKNELLDLVTTFSEK